MHISIHLMLVLISGVNVRTLLSVSISIHLMLVLIFWISEWKSLKWYNFNTSHVSVNPLVKHLSCYLLIHFNTSHVSVNLTNLSLSQSCLNLSLPILSHFSKNYQPINLFLTIELITLQLQVITGFLENFFINCLVNIFII